MVQFVVIIYFGTSTLFLITSGELDTIDLKIYQTEAD